MPSKKAVHLLARVFCRGPLAQLVEHRTFNPRVVGSSPTGPTLRVSRLCALSAVLRIGFSDRDRSSPGGPTLKIYSDFPARRIRQLTGDILAVALITVSILVGVYVHSLVMELATFGVQVEEAGEGFSDTLTDVGDKVAVVPFLGSGVQNLFNDASDAGTNLADAGRSGQEAISNLAIGLGSAIAVLPIIIILALWLFPRIRFVRRARVATQLLSSDASLDLLALRALTSQKLTALNAVSTSPAAYWRRGDAATIRSLAALELKSSGVRVQPRLTR